MIKKGDFVRFNHDSAPGYRGESRIGYVVDADYLGAGRLVEVYDITEVVVVCEQIYRVSWFREMLEVDDGLSQGAKDRVASCLRELGLIKS